MLTKIFFILSLFAFLSLELHSLTHVNELGNEHDCEICEVTSSGHFLAPIPVVKDVRIVINPVVNSFYGHSAIRKINLYFNINSPRGPPTFS
jgi:hypothetical protein